MKRIGIYIILIVALVACKEQEEQEPLSQQQVQAAEVIVLNEGNFQWGNASISLYNPNDNTIENKVFQKNNNNIPIGDVVQSMIQIGDLGYFVINNSNKIRVINLNAFKSEGAIENLNSPRYILPINPDKAYVSDLYEDKIYVVNLESKAILKTIPTKGWTEEMVLVGNRAFVCQVDSSQLLVFDTRNDSLLKRISTNTSPYHLEVDVNQKVWVSCSGGNSALAALHKIDPSSLEVEQTIEAPSTDNYIGEIELSPQKDQLYYISENGVNRISISDSLLPSQTWLSANGRNIYGISINANNGEIYLCDAVDYQQHGVIYRYSSAGTLIDQFSVGIIPGDVYFKE